MPQSLHDVLTVLATTPTPSPSAGVGTISPQAPSFAGKFTQLISWILWGCTMLCVVGIAYIGTQLAVSIRRGETGEHVARLGSAAAGVIIVGLASTIVNALL